MLAGVPVAPASPDLDVAGAPALPLGRRRARHRARRTADVPVPRRGLGGRALPARALPVRARRRRARRRRPLVRPGRPRAARRSVRRAGGDATTLIVTGIPWRTGWRYAERGFRHIYWDGGHDARAGARAGRSAGCGRACGPASPTRRSPARGRRRRARVPGRAGQLRRRRARDRAGRRGRGRRGGRGPAEFPLVTHAQRAGDGDALGAPWPLGAAARTIRRPRPTWTR